MSAHLPAGYLQATRPCVTAGRTLPTPWPRGLFLRGGSLVARGISALVLRGVVGRCWWAVPADGVVHDADHLPGREGKHDDAGTRPHQPPGVRDDCYPAGGECGDHHAYQHPGRGLAMRVAAFWDVPVLDLFRKGAPRPEGNPGPGPAAAQLAPAPPSPAPGAWLDIGQEHCADHDRQAHDCGNRGQDESGRGAQQLRMRCPDCWWWIHLIFYFLAGGPPREPHPRPPATACLQAAGVDDHGCPRTVGIGRYPRPPPGERARAVPRTRARGLARSPAGCPIIARSFLRAGTNPGT
jgi:hypothetical protein